MNERSTKVAGLATKGIEPRDRKWAAFGIVSIALFMSSIDGSIVATALPTLHHVLHAPLNWVGWTITAYSLGQIIAMPMAGRTSDQYGRRKVFLTAIALFTVTSLLCGLSTSIYELIPFRVLQALGGGAFLPSAIGVISDSFGNERDKAIGFTTSILPAGALIGPVLGGLFISYWSWRGIFLVNVPIGILLLVIAPRFIAPSQPKPGAHTDLVGVAQLGLLVLGLMYAITALGNSGTQLWSPVVMVSFAVSIAAGIGFVRRARRVAMPILPLGLVAGKGFLAVNTMNFTFGLCSLGVGSLIPLYAQDRYGVSVLQSATLLTARAVGMMAIGAIAALLLRRTGYRLPMRLGLTMTAVSSFLIATGAVGLSPYWWLALAGALSGIAFGFAAPATNNAILALAPEHVGAITGLRGLFRYTGTILGISISTALATRSGHPATELSHIYFVLGVVLLLALVIVRRVPEHREGAW